MVVDPSTRRRAELGACIVVLTLVCAILPPWLQRPGESDGAGELEITSGRFAGTRLLTPTFVECGESIPTNGTAEARLLWIENLCDGVLDCEPCPPKLDASFNVTTLDGAILIYYPRMDERMLFCGLNRLGRALGGTGLVALGYGCRDSYPLFTPGLSRKPHSTGAYRDSRPRDGDSGIPFPHAHFSQPSLNPIVESLEDGDDIRGIMTPAAPNPWLAPLYGPWMLVRAVLIVGHLSVAERSASFFIGHAKASGLRLDLAQTALTAETIAHIMYSVWLLDPSCSFYWGLMPYGSNLALLICPTMFMCCSTLLLAAYWCGE